MIDIAGLIVVGVVTWMVATEGVWGAAQTFLCALLAGLLAMNFFEPLANQLRAVVPDAYVDIVAILGLFTGLVFGFRIGLEQLTPSYVQVVPMFDTIGRWVVGAGTGYLTMAILLTALQTAPLPREFMGFKADGDKGTFFGSFPDRQWLGFTQYVSEKPLAIPLQYGSGPKALLYARAFDGRFEIVGDPQKPYASTTESPQAIWPSFPIRYAMRRGRLGTGQQASTAEAAPIQVTPATPNSGQGGGVANPGF